MRQSLFVLTGLLFCVPLRAQDPPKPSVVPPELQWVKSIDIQGFAGMEDQGRKGVQHGRLRWRYRDPEVNAFVGMQFGMTRFHEKLSLEDPDNPRRGNVIWDGGANIGIVRGRHLWELDLMGVTAAGKLAAGLAIVGEHRLTSRVTFYHRTQIDAFTGDGILDADQGFYWMMSKNVGFDGGYRIFATQHSHRNHAHIGLRLYFEGPKIPFIFPSVG